MIDSDSVFYIAVAAVIIFWMSFNSGRSEIVQACEIGKYYECDMFDVRSERCTTIKLKKELYLQGGNESCILYKQGKGSSHVTEK